MSIDLPPAPLTADQLGRLPIGGDAGGRSVDGRSDVRFPYDGSVIARAAYGTVGDAQAALQIAAGVRREMAGVGAGVRRSVLTAVGQLIARQADSLVELLILETGKPRRDCVVEVDRTILTWTLAAEEPARLHGETVPLDLLPSGKGLVGYFDRRPAGVVVGIAGFNYPLMLASHKLAPAIAAACPVIVKPAPATPLATLWLVHRIREIAAANGMPVGAVQMVTGDADVGSALTTDPRVAVVSFTGSAAVGHAIATACAPRKVLLELGSNAALVVCADADLDAAADAVVRGGFYASGQACISVQRVVVEQGVRAEFERAVVRRMDEVIVGDPREAATTVSALIDQRAADRTTRWVSQAVDAGARVVWTGAAQEAAVDSGDGAAGSGSGAATEHVAVGDGVAGSGAATEHSAGIDNTAGAPRSIVQPTVLAEVPKDQPVWCEEVFAPVVAITEVPDLDTALDVVNDSRYGLHAAVFTRSLATAYRAIDELEVGGVVINDVPGFRSDAMPYGGVKDSGIGREGPRWAVEEFTVTRMAVIRP